MSSSLTQPDTHKAQSTCGLTRLAWQTLGVVSLGLGVVGVLLPLLPTTPFLIFAAFAFARSAPSLHSWLMRNRTFGPIIADWQAHGAIAPRYKCLALGMMAGALGLTVAMGYPGVILAVQTICMVAAAAFILSRPSRKT
ncbi:MAG: YbaN family protein [Hoeflea sp.]|uniref:YbaN family protein n=1 Tax=Hoeflea sp. TaxID=1940281 RepID=UPI003296D5E3